MGREMIFTQEELNTFSKEGLRRLCDYFKVEIVGKATKKQMIDALVVFMKEHEDVEEDDHPKSAMVKRIHDRMKEK